MNNNEEMMNCENGIEVQKSYDDTGAIEILTSAFRDYKDAMEKRFEGLKSQQDAIRSDVIKSIQTVSHVKTDDMPMTCGNDNVMEYITKGASSFAVHGGYSILPEVSYTSDPETSSLMRILATGIKQQSGTEHTLIKLSDAAFVPGDQDVTLVEPMKINLSLHKIEIAIFLQSSLTSNTPANFDLLVKNGLYRNFAKFENDFFISDAGVEGKIGGIGNLTGAGYKTVTLDYNSNAQELYSKLFSMISAMPRQYLDKAVWMMSPRMFDAIASIRDRDGRLMNAYSHQNPVLFGIPVHCHENFDRTTNSIVLANVKEGYTFVEYPNTLALHDNYKNRNGVTNYFTRLIGGAVTNSSAWVSMKINNLPEDELHFEFAE